MTSLKRHFLEFFLAEFDKIFGQGVKLMSNKVLKVWRRHLLNLSSYSEYSRVGQNMPPSGARVKGNVPPSTGFFN